jgi:hypothetical protein
MEVVWGRECKSFLISAVGGGMSGHRHALAALYPRGKDPSVPVVHEAGWDLEPSWTQRPEEELSSSVGD